MNHRVRIKTKRLSSCHRHHPIRFPAYLRICDVVKLQSRSGGLPREYGGDVGDRSGYDREVVVSVD